MGYNTSAVSNRAVQNLQFHLMKNLDILKTVGVFFLIWSKSIYIF